MNNGRPYSELAEPLMHTILLVEDNPQHADLAMRILKTAGYEILHAARGHGGIELARKQLTSLIVMDLELPDMTGQTACMLIHKYLREKTPPIIAVTSHDGEAYRQSAKQAGCQAFMTKPYQPFQLLQTVKYFLERMPLADSAVLV